MWAIVGLAFFFGRPFALFAGEWGFVETLQGIGLVMLISFVVNGLSMALLSKPEIDPEDKKVYQGTWGQTIFIVAIFAPVLEELIFRYCLVGALYDWSPAIALGLSGLIFGIVHKYYKGAKVIKGVCYAWLYVMSGTIWAPIFAHGLWNLMVVIFVKKKQERRLYRGW